MFSLALRSFSYLVALFNAKTKTKLQAIFLFGDKMIMSPMMAYHPQNNGNFVGKIL